MLAHIPELVSSGVDSLKIEGRVKGISYIATIVDLYRRELDRYATDPVGYRFDPATLDRLREVSNRDYTTNYYFADPIIKLDHETTQSYKTAYDFVGIVKAIDPMGLPGRLLIQTRNKIFAGDTVEFTGKSEEGISLTIEGLTDLNLTPREFMQPEQLALIEVADSSRFMINMFIRRPKITAETRAAS
jgi:putative protease